jgi:hypothetical protein
MNNTKTNSAEIQKKITQLEALYNNPKTDAKFKPLYKKGIEELKAKLEKAEPKVTATAQKEKPKAPVKKNVSKVVAKSTKPKVEQKVKSEVKKISSKKVEIDGKEYDIDSKEFCDYLVAEFKERRATPKTKTKTKTQPKENKLIENLKKGLVVRFEQNKGVMDVSQDMFYDADADEIILFTEITAKNGKKGNSEEIIDEKKALDTYSKLKQSKRVAIVEFYE